MLHGIDEPHIWRCNTLTERPTYDGRHQDAPATLDVVLTNPPFGGKEGEAAQHLPVQDRGHPDPVPPARHRIGEGWRPRAIVIDEGALYRSDDAAFVQTRRKLLDECEVDASLSLPAGGLLVRRTEWNQDERRVLREGRSIENVWFYDLSNVKVGKTRPLHARDSRRLLGFAAHQGRLGAELDG